MNGVTLAPPQIVSPRAKWQGMYAAGSDVEHAAKEHALRCFPEESVGCVIDGAYVPLENEAADPQESFYVPEWPSQAEAIIHSHPASRLIPRPEEFADFRAPSSDDMRSQQATGLPWGITVCDGRSASSLEWFGDEVPYVEPLLGRTFLSGVRDCWCLIRDVYRQQFGILLDNLPRDSDWYRQGIDLLNLQSITAAGFRQIDPSEVRPGDVLLGQVASVSRIVNHCGLFIGRGGQVLHQLHRRLSVREPLKPWQRSIRYCVRHEIMDQPGAEWRLEL